MEDCAMEARHMFPEAEEENLPSKGSEGCADAEDKEEEEEKRGGGGGILNNLLGNLVAPMSPRASAATTEAAGDEDHRRETFHDLPPPPPRGAPADEVVSEKSENVVGDDEGSSGIIDSIVSHLPKSLPGMLSSLSLSLSPKLVYVL
ncbi:unnamed protein product [Linum tenue]|uniref:Uncharacterized protein n=1 Tax=Linum tenue TaxID=586396 RepID=A0AAV0KR78_9ROSI|nr:unnamed protein product [Linum tenue]